MIATALPPRFRGFTLIELLVVLTMVGVLGALAAPSLRSSRINQNLGGAASELMVDTMQARAQALKTSRRVIVEPVSGGDWRTGWNVFVELTADNTYTAGSDTLVFTKEALSPDVQIGATSCVTGSASICARIAYDADGFAAAVGGVSNCTVPFYSPVTSRTRCVVFDRTGRVRVCDPSSGAPC